MPGPIDGRTTVEYLIGKGRLEQIEPGSVAAAASVVIARAARRLETAHAAQDGDIDGAFAAAYDSYRMAAEALLLRQGLRATGGDGSHVTVEDAVSAQFGREISAFAKPTFERLRRTRHSAQYFDPTAPEIEAEDVDWAIRRAAGVVEAVRARLADDPPPVFS